jgi:hypothetical protein
VASHHDDSAFLRGDAESLTAQTVSPRQPFHSGGRTVVDLDYYPEFLGEQGGKHVVLLPHVHHEAAVARHSHFHDRGDEPTIAAVVIGQNESVGDQFLHQFEAGCKQSRFDHIGHIIPDLSACLGKRRSSKSAVATSEV